MISSPNNYMTTKAVGQACRQFKERYGEKFMKNSYGTNSGNRTSYYLGKHRNILTPLYYPGNNL